MRLNEEIGNRKFNELWHEDFGRKSGIFGFKNLIKTSYQSSDSIDQSILGVTHTKK